jgi:hypothetical protein
VVRQAIGCSFRQFRTNQRAKYLELIHKCLSRVRDEANWSIPRKSSA